MSEKTLLSFVIPVYNVEKYLNECLDSIFDPTVDEEEYEVIAIDDGSTDGSPDILKTYTHHKNFRIITQENAGQGPARNPGIKTAMGKYIHFTDSDDYLLPGAVPKLLGFARESDCDIVEFEAELSNETSGSIVFPKQKMERTPASGNGKAIFVEWSKQHIFRNEPWRRIYKTSFLNSNQLYFSDLRISGNDAEWQIRCFFYAEKMFYRSVSLYRYRRWDGSVTSVSKGNKMYYDRIQLIEALNKFRKRIGHTADNADFLAELGATLAVWLGELVNAIYKTAPKKDRKKMLSQIKAFQDIFSFATDEKGKRRYQIARWLPAGLAYRMYKFF